MNRVFVHIGTKKSSVELKNKNLKNIIQENCSYFNIDFIDVSKLVLGLDMSVRSIKGSLEIPREDSANILRNMVQ
jgi:hypothetical protein